MHVLLIFFPVFNIVVRKINNDGFWDFLLTTLQHAVIGLPVFSSQSLPEARRLHSLITLMYGYFTAAVKTCLQGTPGRNKPTYTQQLVRLTSLLYVLYLGVILWLHSLLLDLERSLISHAACMQLRLAAVPKVDESFVDVEHNHGGSGAQAAAVAGHLQQVALHWHLAPHTVQTPFACTQTRGGI